MLLFIGNIMVIVVIAIVFFVFVLISLFIKWYKIPQIGTAIVRTGSDGVKVSFDKGMFVMPTLHKFEIMDIKQKSLDIDLTRSDAIKFSNNLKVEIKAVFYIGIPRTIEDVINVATSVGCANAMEEKTLNRLFRNKFTQVLEEVVQNTKEEKLIKPELQIKVMENIGADLNGYQLEDCVFEYLKINKTIENKTSY